MNSVLFSVVLEKVFLFSGRFDLRVKGATLSCYLHILKCHSPIGCEIYLVDCRTHVTKWFNI